MFSVSDQDSPNFWLIYRVRSSIFFRDLNRIPQGKSGCCMDKGTIELCELLECLSEFPKFMIIINI